MSKKIYLELSAPRTGDLTADRERLQSALKSEVGKTRFSYEVFRRDYRNFRRMDWKVTATLVWTGECWEITAVEAGDTTSEHYGLAVDLGSTMMAMQLVDMNTGEVLAADGAPNPQIPYGEDILSRITYGKDNEEHIRTLQQCVVTGFQELIDRMSELSGVDARKAALMTVGGNTTMIHFLMGVDAFCVFMTPFTPTFNDVGFIHGSELGLDYNGMIYCVPSIANYLGGDIISGLLTVDMVDNDKLCLYMDIGTNGEMVLGSKEFLFAGAGAAGPALEGGVSKFGIRAKPGAVSHLKIEKNDLVISTIGDEPALGICGSGIVDLLAEMLLSGWMDKQGKLIREASPRIVERDGVLAVIYAYGNESASGEDLYFTENDIVSFRETKAAANTMVACLLEASEIDPSAIDIIYMVGGFGEHIDLESAITIGMYPDVDRSKFVSIGNGSLNGCYKLLTDREQYGRIRHICENIYYLEFAQFPDFIMKMSAAGFFPHTDLESYPSVIKKMAERRNK
ncbi:MAG: ASKHA domain-containing protein [Clostridia bacterium]